ncbi:MAG TPA: polysaccharide biosynthesis C-terminal domain-containing protein, partial [Chloroflexota bacterium]|nr:polysaccharide biosynthesis C-terminal domain-containing protein [Chloroflexota bacterium]
VSIPVGLLAVALPAALARVAFRRPSLRTASIGLLAAALPFAILAGSSILYDRVDVLMLAHLSSARSVGVYSAADRLVEGLLVIPAGIGAALYPSLANDPGRAWVHLRTLFRWALPLGLAITLLCLGPGAVLISILYGSEYGGIDGAFRLLCWTVLLESATVPLAYLLQAQSRMLAAVAATSFGLLVNVLLNLALIPRFSYRGASISASLAELAVLIALCVLILADHFGWTQRLSAGRREVIQ